jgi:Polyketide cyclase / dehydrase and lipid transport
MKIFRLFIFFLLALVVVTAVLSLMMPTNQKINRSITINAPAAVIYEQLKTLKNFNRFSVWSQQDSTIQYSLTGTDGTVGAATSWKGIPDISGEGKIEITSLAPTHTVSHKINFTTPRKGKANSTFSIIEKEKGSSDVTWYFELATPRPWNIFNLFYSFDKQMGKDFEAGLAAMKLAIELSQKQVQ